VRIPPRTRVNDLVGLDTCGPKLGNRGVHVVDQESDAAFFRVSWIDSRHTPIRKTKEVGVDARHGL